MPKYDFSWLGYIYVEFQEPFFHDHCSDTIPGDVILDDGKDVSDDSINRLRFSLEQHLALACPDTTDSCRIPILVDKMIFTFVHPVTGQRTGIRGNEKLRKALFDFRKASPTTTTLPLQVSCARLKPNTLWNGTNLDNIGTDDSPAFPDPATLVPPPVPIPTVSTSAAGIPPAPAMNNTPPSLWNINNLPPPVRTRYDAY